MWSWGSGWGELNVELGVGVFNVATNIVRVEYTWK